MEWKKRKVQSVACYGEEVSSDQGPERVTQANSPRILGPLRVGIENAKGI